MISKSIFVMNWGVQIYITKDSHANSLTIQPPTREKVKTTT